MAFIFTMRSAPIGGSMHRRDLTSSSSLPAISEDGASFVEPRQPPPVPPRAWNRPLHKQFNLGATPVLNYEGSPPAYSHFDDTGVEGPHGEKLPEVRKGITNNKHIAKRGGWKRLALIALIAIICIVALVVGLVVGLRNRNRSSSSASSSESQGSGSTPSGGASGTVEPGPRDPAANATFPAGSYSFNTYLNTVATNCTSHPATWTCYPFLTYAQSASQSSATFDWIISSVKDSSNYTISSTSNPFSISFSNASLSLMKQGQADEHYFFQISMTKPTKPTTQLGSDNVAATCYFNDTTLQAYLYTKMANTYNGTAGAFETWPHAVKIEQVAGAGAGTPDCQGPSGNSLGDFSVQDGTQLCDCLYLNTDT